jgi:5-methylcytosine-specific restriction endonuclease McrA
MKCNFCKKTFKVENLHNPYQMYCSKLCNKKSYWHRNKNRLNKEQMERYNESRKKIIFPTFICKHCGITFKGKTLLPRVFCSKKCLKNNWMKVNKVYMRKMVKDWYHKNLDRARELGRKNAAKRYPKFREQIIHNSQMANTKRRGVPGSFTLKEWNDLKEKHNFTCACRKCGAKEPDIKLTHDHIISLKKGGTNFISNIQPYCFSCNSSKGTRLSCQGNH